MPKAKPLPPLELVEQLLDYDPETGMIKWKKAAGRHGRIPSGTIATQGKNDRYLRVSIGGRFYAAHRLIWLISYKIDPAGLQVDHINGNTKDNRLSNLRLATDSQNAQNSRRPVTNTSGFKGVYWSNKKWVAQIYLGNQQHYLGRFDTPELAHMAYCKAAAELHGEFARAA